MSNKGGIGTLGLGEIRDATVKGGTRRYGHISIRAADCHHWASSSTCTIEVACAACCEHLPAVHAHLIIAHWGIWSMET